MSIVKGYKVFNPDWTCKGFRYEVGKTFVHNGNIEMSKAGFHFCRKAADCFNYYPFNNNNKVAEIEAVGTVITEGKKSVTDTIKIIREISWRELLDIVNMGSNCTGLCNVGDRNVGDRNMGNANVGDHNVGGYNVGDNNVGDDNAGDCNMGDANVGYYNAGNYNVGNYNVGYYNVGDWNRAKYSTGFFNTSESPVYIFNKPTTLSHAEIWNCRGMEVLRQNYVNSQFIKTADMSEEERKSHPEFETTGGYLKTVDFKTACRMMWDKLSTEDRQAVMNLPNFGSEVFEEITGIDVTESEGKDDADE